MSETIRYVVGPAGSGKSTYVRLHMSPGDLVLDFDAIAVAIGSPAVDHHRIPHPAAHRAIVRAVWPALHRLFLASAERGVPVWIIHAEPSPEALRLYRSRGAVIVLPKRIDPRPNP